MDACARSGVRKRVDQHTDVDTCRCVRADFPVHTCASTLSKMDTTPVALDQPAILQIAERVTCWLSAKDDAYREIIALHPSAKDCRTMATRALTLDGHSCHFWTMQHVEAVSRENPPAALPRGFHAFQCKKQLGEDLVLIVFRSERFVADILPVVEGAETFRDGCRGGTTRGRYTDYTITARVGAIVTVTWTNETTSLTKQLVAPKTTRALRCDIPYPCSARRDMDGHALFLCDECGSCQHMDCTTDAGFCMRCENDRELPPHVLENGWSVVVPVAPVVAAE